MTVLLSTKLLSCVNVGEEALECPAQSPDLYPTEHH